MDKPASLSKRIKKAVLGASRNPHDKTIFHQISLIAFFAWVGLGADGMSSSCYGPEEAFKALLTHKFLSVFVALGTMLTIYIISACYSQIIELFPTGGGGYLVASKLLSPSLGMVSGCALLIDYVLTITVSIASGADAIFSFLPLPFHQYRMLFAALVLLLLIVLNMRGVKESILPLIPIFLTFIITHVIVIGYSIATHVSYIPQLAVSTGTDIQKTISEVGIWGLLFLIMRSYSMGAGTYTGIEAVSNGLPVLREPRVKTAKATMRYMALSLAFIVMGLMLSYLFYQVGPHEGKTLNATLFELVTQEWGGRNAYLFVLITLISEATLLFIAAQAGFLDGPRVLANMAVDRWFPARFSSLSDRLVTQNGVLFMGILALVLLFVTKGSVGFLVVLYSINVFITFSLSLLGMVRHWWQSRRDDRKWMKKFLLSLSGFLLTTFILVTMIVFKFNEGGWITLFITAALIVFAVLIKRHYYQTAKLLHRLNGLIGVTESTEDPAGLFQLKKDLPPVQYDPKAKTAVLLVNGFNGVGLHTLFGIIRSFGGVFKNFVFVQIGVVDVGNFKGVQEMDSLQAQVKHELEKYVHFMNRNGYYAEAVQKIGVDVIEEASRAAPPILQRFPNAIFFGGQLVFPKDTFLIRFLHNYTVFSLQKRLYREGILFVILPIRV